MDANISRQEAYQTLPAVQRLLVTDWGQRLVREFSHSLVSEAVSQVLAELRQALTEIAQPDGTVDGRWWAAQVSMTNLQQRVEARLRRWYEPVLTEVLNLTGVVIHTNLGRAPLSRRGVEAVTRVARGYSNLEYQLETGLRGSRHAIVEERLCRLTGAEAAMVVNNNAAAVFLVLRELGRGGEAIVSRGELVEIGGSFRIPSIMVESGVKLAEVGTTNKTHLNDYEEAVTPETRLLLRVHPSNFRIVGFTETPALADLSQVAHSHGLWLYEDLGSGALLDLSPYGFGTQSTVRESLAQGADVVSFSGDKLLGSAQAGIIVGRRQVVDRLKRNQLARVLRVDKMTLAALESTLMDLLNPLAAVREVPVMAMIAADLSQVRDRAQRVAAGIGEALAADPEIQGAIQGVSLRVVADTARIGGGALPEEELPSFAIEVEIVGVGAQRLSESLRRNAVPPVIGHVTDDAVLLNVRTLLPGQEEACIGCVAGVCRQLLIESL